MDIGAERFALQVTRDGFRLEAPSHLSFADFCSQAGTLAQKLGFTGPAMAGRPAFPTAKEAVAEKESCKFFDIASEDDVPEEEPPGLSCACEKGIKVDDAMELTAQMQPEASTYTALFCACEKGQKVEKALELHYEMQQKGLIPSVSTFTCSDTGAGTTNGNGTGTDTSRGIGTDTCSACEEGHKAEAMVPPAEMQPEVSPEAEKAMELQDDMQATGLEPNGTTDPALISAGAQGNRVEKTSEATAGTQQLGVTSDVPTCNALISACEKGNKAEKAIELHDDMQATGLEPKNKALSSACEKGGDVVLRPSLLDIGGPRGKRKGKVKGKPGEHLGLFPDVQTHNALSSACETDHQAEKTIELHTDMQATGLGPNGTTSAAFISACAQGNKVEKTATVFAGKQQIGLTPDVPCYTLLSACEKGNKAEKAIELHDDMQATGLKPKKAMELTAEMQQRLNTCGKMQQKSSPQAPALISACGKGNNVEETRELFAGRPVNEALISACEKEDKGHKVEAMELLMDSQLRGACEKGNKVEKAPRKKKKKEQLREDPEVATAMELLTEMQQRNLITGANAHDGSISACDKGDKVKEAMEAFAESQQSACEKSKTKQLRDEVGTTEKAMGMVAEVQHIAYEKHHQVDRAMISVGEKDHQVKKAMGQLKDPRATIAYNALISACETRHKVQAMKLFVEMQQREYMRLGFIIASEKGIRLEQISEKLTEWRWMTYGALWVCGDSQYSQRGKVLSIERSTWKAKQVEQIACAWHENKENKVKAMELFAVMQQEDEAMFAKLLK